MTELIAINCYARKQYLAMPFRYACGMERRTRDTLKINLERLMASQDPAWTQDDVAEKSGVSQRTISNLLHPERDISPTMDNVEAVARAFGLETWHLLLPDIPQDLLQSKSIEKIVQCYQEATPEGRANINRIAESEVRYRALQDQNVKKQGNG